MTVSAPIFGEPPCCGPASAGGAAVRPSVRPSVGVRGSVPALTPLCVCREEKSEENLQGLKERPPKAKKVREEEQKMRWLEKRNGPLF